MFNIFDLEYEERLEILELPKLQDRRTRGEMILTYRLLNGEEGIDYRKLFALETRELGLRGHNRKIALGPGVDSGPRSHFFSRRVIEKWNKLTWEEVNAPSTSTFKTRYDEKEKLRQAEIRNNIYTTGTRRR